MPFASKRQWRAAMAGYIPGLGGEKAHEWAHETPSFSKLPDRAAAERGKPTLQSKTSAKTQQLAYVVKKLRKHMEQPAEKRAMIEFFAKTAFAVPNPGAVMQSAKHVGSFKGVATNNFMKAPGAALESQVVNPRLNVRHAMTKTMRT